VVVERRDDAAPAHAATPGPAARILVAEGRVGPPDERVRCLLDGNGGETCSCYSPCCGAAIKTRAQQASNSPSGIWRRPHPFGLRRCGVLGFNLNNLGYLFVAAFKSGGTRRRL
jgi:hypothetical protein